MGSGYTVPMMNAYLPTKKAAEYLGIAPKAVPYVMQAHGFEAERSGPRNCGAYLWKAGDVEAVKNVLRKTGGAGK